MYFASDNTTGASSPILEAIVRANDDDLPSYGADHFCDAARALVDQTFEKSCAVFFVANGTAANALALAGLAPPGSVIFCAMGAHIQAEECGAPEFFTQGAKLALVETDQGKITPDAFEAMLRFYPQGPVRQAQPAVLSLTQASDVGTVYLPEEICVLSDMAHAKGLSVHMDGARFANALAALNVSPADLSWRAGVDVLSLGLSKNGGLVGEAIIFFSPDQARDFAFRCKRGAQTIAKARVYGAQLQAYLQGGHWLDLARSANASARRLAQGLQAVDGVSIVLPQQVNQVFVWLPRFLHEALVSHGVIYYEWASPDCQKMPPHTHVFARFVTSYATQAEKTDQFLSLVKDIVRAQNAASSS